MTAEAAQTRVGRTPDGAARDDLDRFAMLREDLRRLALRDESRRRPNLGVSVRDLVDVLPEPEAQVLVQRARTGDGDVG